MSRIAAFFDLDRTLITVNSGRLWLERERQEKRVSAWQMVEATFYLFAYSLHAVDMDGVMVKALQTVKGVDEDTVRSRTRDWFDREVKQHEAPGARAALQDHRDQGHLCVLLTASSPYESEAATAHFGLDAWLSTRYQVVEGRFTGDVVRPLCYGAGKVVHAERFAAEHGIDIDRSFFYTDSITDLPMLERVQNPRVVQPDLRLGRLARRRGWPILDWSQARAGG
ncbi:MAG: HAD-IB family hydrolase [Pseudomonadota bacterium]